MDSALIFQPADSFIVRDGRPFNQDDAGQATAVSVFPPPPFTLYGATRVAIARALGWIGRGSWTKPENMIDADRRSAELCTATLGNYGQPGALKVRGPFLVHSNGQSQRAFVPAPANLRVSCGAEADAGAISAMGPGESDLQSDLEPQGARFVELGALGARDVQNAWLDATFLPEYLNDVGGWSRSSALDSALVAADDIVVVERRIGLAIDHGSRLAEHGQLYASARRRLRPGWSIAVEFNLGELPVKDPALLPRYVPFGSESRFAYLDVAGSQLNQPAIEFRKSRYAILLVTPAFVDPPNPDRPFAGLPGTVISAAMQRPQYLGAFQDSIAPSGDPTTRTALPAGSVVFFECEHDDLPAVDKPAEPIGAETQAGFGHYLYGAW